MERSLKAISTIRECLSEHTYGYKNRDALAAIAKAVNEIRWEFGDHGCVRERLTSLNGWADMLYSARKHVGRGTDEVKHFIRLDLDSIEKYLHHGSSKKPQPEG